MKPGRNSPCPCGSGQKYKHCCEKKTTHPIPQVSATTLAQILRTIWMNLEAGRLLPARVLCEESMSRMPNQPDIVYMLALTYLQDGDAKSAQNLLERVVALDSKKPQFWTSLGLAYHEQGLLNKAIETYQKALDLSPNWVDALYNLHAVQIQHEDLSTSIHSLEKLLMLNPKDDDARFMLALLLELQGDSGAQNIWLQLSSSSDLIQARIDAWQYLKKDFKAHKPLLTGSMISTFQVAFDCALAEGLVLEFGVRHGNTIRQIASIASGEIHGFDSFEGLPEAWHEEAKGSYSTRGIMPEVPDKVKLYRGWFEDTLPLFLKTHTGPVRLLHIDCDMYHSTKTVLDLLSQQIVPGTVIIFDEYIGNLNWREDEFKAFQESVNQQGWTYEYIAFSFFTKQVAIKVTRCKSKTI
jgi:tetratricopeptide (TPR) repeat protein